MFQGGIGEEKLLVKKPKFLLLGYSFEPVFSVHCLAAPDLWAGVEKSIECLIIQNRQAVQITGRSIDWTLENNMVNGLIFCALSQVAKSSIFHLCKQEQERLTLVRRPC